MKDYEYYSNVPVKFPNRNDYTTYYVYSKGDRVFKGTKEGLDKEFPEGIGNRVMEKDFDKDSYTVARKEYYNEANKLQDEFQDDLFKEFGVEHNPKRDKCYSLAYEYGHSSGFSEIYTHFSEFVELIKD